MATYRQHAKLWSVLLHIIASRKFCVLNHSACHLCGRRHGYVGPWLFYYFCDTERGCPAFRLSSELLIKREKGSALSGCFILRSVMWSQRNRMAAPVDTGWVCEGILRKGVQGRHPCEMFVTCL